MEERALYRAILASPHDDAPRLIYADWLDENADAFPAAQARAERARAEFIRLQCKIARLNPTGWTQSTPAGTSEPSLAKRQTRLLFHHGRKWRRAFPVAHSSDPFDRGFLRPFRALRPQEFLGRLTLHQVPGSPLPPLPPLPENSPARRYVPDEPLAACPLWDLHLFASGWQGDALADHWHYGEWLAEVGKSPQLERVGWLKVSFFQTSTAEFLRTGRFPNVETLVLNSGPFPEVLEAVAENESFRSLRYIHFGNDRWAWAGTFPMLLQFFALSGKIREASNRNLPYGEMRPVLRSILRDTPLVPVDPLPPVPVPPIHVPHFSSAGGSTPAQESAGKAAAALSVLAGVFLVIVSAGKSPSPQPPTVPAFKMPDIPQIKYDPKEFQTYKHSPELEALLKQYREGKKPSESDLFKNFLRATGRDGKPKGPPPEAPAPRPVQRKNGLKEETPDGK